MSRRNGLIGGIENVYLRRLALVLLAFPMTVVAMIPPYLRVLPSALAEGWEAFADFYRRPNELHALAFRSAWSKDWKPV